MARATTTISTDSYQEACDAYMGWCPDCKAFTRYSTEPDAHGYDCPECGELNVMGAEDALLLEYVELN